MPSARFGDRNQVWISSESSPRGTERENRRAALAARRAVRVLRGGRLKMSARDAARLLGLSPQRLHQLTRNDA